MICRNCATPLPDDAHFCLRCGMAQTPAGLATAVRREICEVYRSNENGGWFRTGDTFWEAIAIGPQGRYSVGRSETCLRKAQGSTRGVKRADVLLDGLIKQLIQEEWQPLPRGPEWYSYRFERHARAEPAATEQDSVAQSSEGTGGGAERSGDQLRP